MRNILICIALIVLTGCSSQYVVPGPGVNPAALSSVGPSGPRPQPTVKFPARVAVVRVQASGYRNDNVQAYGEGRYSVVTTRDVERDEDVERLGKLPQLVGVAMLNRMVLPPQLSTDRELRQAADRLGADLLLLYTFDTTFRFHDHEIGPLGIITLGTLPNHEAKAISTCSAALFDVRTGYIYGLAEGTGTESELASVWRRSSAIDSARVRAEQKAFGALTVELEKMWAGVLQGYATTGAMSGSAPPGWTYETVGKR